MWQYVAIGAGATAGGLVTTAATIRYMFPWLKYDFNIMKKGFKLRKFVESMEKQGMVTADVFEKAVNSYPNKPLIIFEVHYLCTVMFFHHVMLLK